MDKKKQLMLDLLMAINEADIRKSWLLVLYDDVIKPSNKSKKMKQLKNECIFAHCCQLKVQLSFFFL